jgi:hypothetical protein
MPKIPSGSSSRSRSSSSKSKEPKPKKNPARKTARKTISVSKELKGVKLSVSQIERIIAGEKRSDATSTSIQHSPGEYVRMREIMSKLRFDRYKNLAQITTYLTAIHHATAASKREVGWM